MKKIPGFSSIELIIATALSIILVTMILSAYNGHLRKSRDIERASIAQQIDSTVKNFIKTHAGETPTGTELLTELGTIHAPQASFSHRNILLGFFSEIGLSTFALTDPAGGRSVCLDDVAFPSQLCWFYYIRYTDNTYSVSYGVESPASMEPNFYRTTPCRIMPPTSDCPYDIILGVYRGNARFIGSIATAQTHYTPPANLAVLNSEKATLLSEVTQ